MKFACPHCSKPIDAPLTEAGAFSCPACQNTIMITLDPRFRSANMVSLKCPKCAAGLVRPSLRVPPPESTESASDKIIDFLAAPAASETSASPNIPCPSCSCLIEPLALSVIYGETLLECPTCQNCVAAEIVDGSSTIYCTACETAFTAASTKVIAGHCPPIARNVRAVFNPPDGQAEELMLTLDCVQKTVKAWGEQGKWHEEAKTRSLPDWFNITMPERGGVTFHVNCAHCGTPSQVTLTSKHKFLATGKASAAKTKSRTRTFCIAGVATVLAGIFAFTNGGIAILIAIPLVLFSLIAFFLMSSSRQHAKELQAFGPTSDVPLDKLVFFGGGGTNPRNGPFRRDGGLMRDIYSYYFVTEHRLTSLKRLGP